MSVAHALLRATSALVPTLGWGPGAMRERFFPVPAHSFCMGSHRRLPHIYPQDRWLFLTWHLYGSLPQAQYPPPHHLSAGRAFIWMDRYLDRAEWGPRFLQHESIATLVVTSLWRGVLGEPVSRSGSGNLTTTGSEAKKSGNALLPISRTIR